MSNNYGGYFIIGVNQEKDQNNRTIYRIIDTKLDVDNFSNRVENWLDDYVDPRGQLKYDIYEVTNTTKRCIVIQVYITPGQCFGCRVKSRAYKNTSYCFPIRLSGSTRYMDYISFFSIAFNRYLSSLAAISALKVEEKGIRYPIGGPTRFNAEKAKEFIDLLNNPDIDGIETRSKILENLMDLLPAIPKHDLSDIEKSITNLTIDLMKNEIENENSLTICMDMLLILSSIRDDEIQNKLKENFLEDVEEMYNNLTIEQKTYALNTKIK